jgi:hypothetical protein
MSTAIESVIRPFQTPDIAPSLAAQPQIVAAKTVIINPGRRGGVKTFSGSYDLTITFYMIKTPKEK